MVKVLNNALLEKYSINIGYCHDASGYWPNCGEHYYFCSLEQLFQEPQALARNLRLL